MAKWMSAVLATRDALRVEQKVPYGQILISRGAKMWSRWDNFKKTLRVVFRVASVTDNILYDGYQTETLIFIVGVVA